MNKGLRILLIALAVVVVAGGAFAIWRLRQQTAIVSGDELRTAVVERGTLRVTVTASGRIEPAEQVDLGFDMPGVVTAVYVDLGDAVEAGQPLAELRTTDLQRAMTQAELNLRQAELRLERLQQPPDQADITQAENAVSQAASALEVAQLQLNTVLGSTLLTDQLEDAEYRLQNATSEYANRLGDYNAGRISDFVMDRVTQAYEDAERYLQRTQEEGRLQVESSRSEVNRAAQAYEEAQNRLQQLQEGAEPLDIEAAQLDVEAAQLALDRARSDLADATLTAPFDGIVSAVNATANEMASTGLPAVSLVEVSRFHITVSVDEIDVARLHPGLLVQVTVDAFPNVTFDGVVERIGPAATLDQGAVSYPVVVLLDPTDEPILTGMSATATIMVEELVDQLIIPNWLVRVDQTTGQTFVFRQTAAGYERVDVRLGVRYEGTSQVLNGVEEGQVLVLVRENAMFFGGQ